jgi:hypothetical protein
MTCSDLESLIDGSHIFLIAIHLMADLIQIMVTLMTRSGAEYLKLR